MPETGADQTLGQVQIETISPGVTQIRLDRPERLNALGLQMAIDLEASVERVLADASVRVLLLRGSGRGFCAGADLKERQTMDTPRRVAHNAAINGAMAAIIGAAIPTIAVVNGLALGGGCELALTCDLRVMSDTATIGLTETRIGVIPGAGATQRLPRLIGAPLALEMMLSGEPVSAKRAMIMGLVNHVVPEAELDMFAAALAATIASRSPLGLREIKRLVRCAGELPLAEGLQAERAALAQIVASNDYAEGLAAFAERRAPLFSGT